jgi:hypothetical protein
MTQRVNADTNALNKISSINFFLKSNFGNTVGEISVSE